MRSELEKKGWLVKNEVSLIKRLKFTNDIVDDQIFVNESNKRVRDEVLQSYLSNISEKLADPILQKDDNSDILIGEIDRYGLPLRTVLNTKTGLVRSDPYYNSEWLSNFYSQNYRPLYSTNVDHAVILHQQIFKGIGYLNYVKPFIKKNAKVLEVGCGLGGILIPFKMNGFETKGVDLGNQFIEIGKTLNLNLYCQDISELISAGEKFDLIILSHIVEHIPKVEEFFDQIKKLTTSDGIIFIAVPGILKIHQTYRSDILMYLQNAHCWSFTKRTLTKLLNKFGFEVLECDESINCVAKPSISVNYKYEEDGEANHILKYFNKIEKTRIKTANKSFSGKLINKIKSEINKL